MMRPEGPTNDRKIWTRRDFFKGIGAAGALAFWPDWLRAGEEPAAKVAFVTGDIYSRHETGEFAYENARRLTEIVIAIARDHASGRLVSVLEGGYSLTGLASAVSAHVGTLLGGR